MAEGEPDIGTQQRTEHLIAEHLKLFRERTRRTIQRKLEKGEIEPKDILEMQPDKPNIFDDEFDDDMEELEENEEMEEIEENEEEEK